MKGDIPDWGNAADWAANAESAGYTVSQTPLVGSVADETLGLGHVGVVTEISPDGSQVLLAEQNYDWYGDFRIAWHDTSEFMYIYI